MSQQHPQQPQWGGPQQPAWGAPPPPPKGRSAGKIIGFGCLGIVGLLVAIGVIAAAVNSGGSSNKTSSSPSTTTATHSASGSGSGKAKVGGAKTSKPADVVTFKVWGTAPAGALGPLDIGYGSDSDTRKGAFKDGKFTATLPLAKGAMYFNVNAQLQGSGDIHCSITIGGKTKTGHASGGYNICDAQLSSNFTGGWE
jgi:hypothetical protein